MNTAKWNPIGTVVGSASTSEFTFILKSFKSRVGDLVAVRMDVPDETYNGTQTIYVWGRVVSISRYNPFFPYEAAQELSVSRRTIYNMIATGELEHVEVHERNSRVTSRSVRRAAARRSKPAPIANLKNSGAAK